MVAKGKHVRELGNRNRIVRLHNDDIWFLVENLAVAGHVTHQEAFDELMNEMDCHRQALPDAYLRILVRFRTNSSK